MDRMWDERFLFVTAALVGAAMWVLRSSWRTAVVEGRTGFLQAVTIWLIAIFVVLCLIVRAVLYHSAGLTPDPGTFLAVAIGALFGLFAGVFIIGLLGSGPPPNLWAGAVALLVLSVGYSLPVYHREISALLRDSGFSSLKFSFAEVKVEADLSNKGSSGANSGSGGATGSTASSLVRFTDPTPGLAALAYEFDEDFASDNLNIVDRDIRYMSYLSGAEAPPVGAKALPVLELTKHRRKQYIAAVRPIKLLSVCLQTYLKNISDSQLLLIDIKSSIAPLFLLHENFKLAVDQITKPEGPERLPHDVDLAAAFKPTIKAIRLTLIDPTACEQPLAELETMGQIPNEPVFHPYFTLALADLLLAHGAPDDAVTVLAEWLGRWEAMDAFKKQSGLSDPHLSQEPTFTMPEWFRIRVLAKLQAILEDLAGRNNQAFHQVLRYSRIMSGAPTSACA